MIAGRPIAAASPQAQLTKIEHIGEDVEHPGGIGFAQLVVQIARQERRLPAILTRDVGAHLRPDIVMSEVCAASHSYAAAVGSRHWHPFPKRSLGHGGSRGRRRVGDRRPAHIQRPERTDRKIAVPQTTGPTAGVCPEVSPAISAFGAPNRGMPGRVAANTQS